MAANEEMNRALNKDPANSCQLDFQMANELMTENWDLKKSIGRIRYGRPARSMEDRDTINRLQTENQDLKATVGKLRYQCGQPIAAAAEPVATPRILSVNEPMLNKTLDAMNLTIYWANLMEDENDDELLESLKESAADLIRLIGLRREELDNRTKEASYGKSSRAAEKMQSTLEKSVQKVVSLMERIHNHQEQALALAEDVESRLKDLRNKVESRWAKMLQIDDQDDDAQATTTTTGSSTETSGTSKSLNAGSFYNHRQFYYFPFLLD